MVVLYGLCYNRSGWSWCCVHADQQLIGATWWLSLRFPVMVVRRLASGADEMAGLSPRNLGVSSHDCLLGYHHLGQCLFTQRPLLLPPGIFVAFVLLGKFDNNGLSIVMQTLHAYPLLLPRLYLRVLLLSRPLQERCVDDP